MEVDVTILNKDNFEFSIRHTLKERSIYFLNYYLEKQLIYWLLPIFLFVAVIYYRSLYLIGFLLDPNSYIYYLLIFCEVILSLFLVLIVFLIHSKRKGINSKISVNLKPDDSIVLRIYDLTLYYKNEFDEDQITLPIYNSNYLRLQILHEILLFFKALNSFNIQVQVGDELFPMEISKKFDEFSKVINQKLKNINRSDSKLWEIFSSLLFTFGWYMTIINDNFSLIIENIIIISL